MRGKNIVYLPLIAMLLMSLMISIGFAPSTAKLSIDPSRLPEGGGTMGHPGDSFDMTVKIENVHDLWAIAFSVTFEPFSRPLVVSEVFEGEFMKQGGYVTSFTYKIDGFAGKLKISVTRLAQDEYGMPLPVVGASGDGVLATFVFGVVEAGDSDIGFTDVNLLDSNLDAMPCNTFGGRYYGATANLIRLQILPGRKVTVGTPLVFKVRAIGGPSYSDVTLLVRARFDIERLEDGRRIQFYSGETYVTGGLGEPAPVRYFWCDSYRPAEWGDDWANPGEAVGEPDGVFTYGSAHGQDSGYYGFEDIELLPGESIQMVMLDCYTNVDSLNIDIDPFGFIGAHGWAWADSCWGTPTWAWHLAQRYYPPGYAWQVLLPEVYTEEGLNALEVVLEHYDGGAGELARVDSMRLYVETSPIVILGDPVWTEIGPNEELDLVDHVWNTAEVHIGTYVVTCTLEYTLTGGGETGVMEGAKVFTRTFEIVP